MGIHVNGPVWVILTPAGERIFDNYCEKNGSSVLSSTRRRIPGDNFRSGSSWASSVHTCTKERSHYSRRTCCLSMIPT